MIAYNLGWIALGLFIIMWINLLFMCWLSFKKLELIEGVLEHSRWVSDSKAMWGGGIIGRAYRLNAIAIMIFLPVQCDNRGLVNKSDINRIPKRLRQQIKIVYMVNALTLLGMAILVSYL